MCGQERRWASWNQKWGISASLLERPPVSMWWPSVLPSGRFPTAVCGLTSSVDGLATEGQSGLLWPWMPSELSLGMGCPCKRMSVGMGLWWSCAGGLVGARLGTTVCLSCTRVKARCSHLQEVRAVPQKGPLGWGRRGWPSWSRDRGCHHVEVVQKSWGGVVTDAWVF